MAEAHATPHPTPRQYVLIAILLAGLTAIEVALYYIEVGVESFTSAVSAPLLIMLALVKFVIVVGYYMHLKFEHSLLSKFFVTGFIAAMVLYSAVIYALLVT